MKVTTRPAQRSTVVVEVELPAVRVKQSIDLSVRHLGRRTRIPGFRPGKVPRPMLERALGIRRDDPSAPDPVYDDAKEHLFEGSVVDALKQVALDVLAIPQPEWTAFREGDGAAYRVTIPVRPEVRLGAYEDYPFQPEVEPTDDERIGRVLEQLRDQQASLVPVDGRGAQDGDYAVIGFEGRRDGEVIGGASSERLPLVIGKERMIPGFEAELLGMAEGEDKTFTVTFPDDYGDSDLAGREADFAVRMRELREKSPPDLDDDFARSMGDHRDLSALREDIGHRLERSARDRARHAFADRVIEFATANATLDVPELLVDRETDVMRDELKVRLAEQGIAYDDYLRATERDEDSLQRDYREQAEHRVKVLLVVGAIAEKEGIQVDDGELQAELERGRRSAEGNPRLMAYLESERGRSYIRSQLRRTRTVEMLIDRWIDQHPAFKDVRHSEGESGAETSADEIGSADQEEPAAVAPAPG